MESSGFHVHINIQPEELPEYFRDDAVEKKKMINLGGHMCNFRGLRQSLHGFVEGLLLRQCIVGKFEDDDDIVRVREKVLRVLENYVELQEHEWTDCE